MRRALLLLALLAQPSWAAAPATTPLPPGWTSENDDEGDDDYSAPLPARGIFAHGFANPGITVQSGEPVCQGDEAAQKSVIDRLTSGASEFWFYATASEGVLFQRTSALDPAKPCAQAVSYEDGVSRAFVADGMIHSFEVNANGDLEPASTKPPGYTAGVYSGAFTLIHNLMARRETPGRGRLEHRWVAHVRATCAGMGGIVWSDLCIADGPRTIKGLIVSARAGDDERVMFQLDLDKVKTGARLDGRVFEAGRRWKGP